MNNNKYKDREFYETNKILNEIFDSLNVEYSVLSIENKISHSNQVISKKIGLITNGKGTDKISALCSGKAEMLERIMNYSFVRINSDIITKYNIAPSKYVIRKNKEFQNDIETFLNCEMITNKKVLNLFSLICKEYYRQDYYSVPFFNILNNTKLMIPTVILDFFQGTNGMSTGNSFEEAFIQAYSEIDERIFIKRILTEDCKLEQLEVKYIDNTVIKKLKNNFNGNIYIYRLQSNKPIQSVCLLLIKDRKYRIKFGSHYNIEIAIERCITEMMQGNSIDDKEKWKSINYKYELNNDINLFFKDGSGSLNNVFFNNIRNSKYTLLESNNEKKSNKEIMKNIICHEKNIYVFQNNIGGMYNIQIYIPQKTLITEINTNTLSKILFEIKNNNIFYKKLSILNDSTHEFIKKIIKHYNDNVTLDRLAFNQAQ